jgi:hypothetical protein
MFFIFCDELDWITARATAISYGWDLATITSPGEQSFVEGLVCVDDRIQYWIGGFQEPTNSEPADNWKWVTGEEWDWTYWGDDDQPDDWRNTKGHGEQYCLALDSSFG